MSHRLYIDDPLKDDVIYAVLQRVKQTVESGLPLSDEALLKIDWDVRGLFYGQITIRKNPDRSLFLKPILADIGRGVPRRTVCEHYGIPQSRLYRWISEQ